jgi:DNA polymerase-3 subunit gamma/tau
MRRLRNTIGKGLTVGVLGASVVALSGCGWLFGDSSPSSSAKVRPGADRQAPATNALPRASGQQHDAGVAANDPAGNAQIGSIVPAKGGQKAQKEAAEKEATERAAKEREEREKREAEERDAKAKEPKPEVKPLPPAGTLPAMPAAAERGNPENAEPGDKDKATAPAAAPVPGPAPVTTAPVAPVAPAAPAPPTAPSGTPPKT